MTIKDQKTRRDELWAELDDIQAEKAPIEEREKAIRDEIKTIQEALYIAHMKPVLHALERDLSEGRYEGEDEARMKDKLTLLKAKLG